MRALFVVKLAGRDCNPTKETYQTEYHYQQDDSQFGWF